MKKLLLVAVAFCCMTAAMAQSMKSEMSSYEMLKNKAFRNDLNNRETTAITHRLDSVVVWGGLLGRLVSVYDLQYHCIRDSVNELIFLSNTYEYKYNNENQLSTITYGDKKIELTYNAQGLATETAEYTNSNGNWLLKAGTRSTYDSNGNLKELLSLTRSGNEWINKARTEYTYNQNMLVIKMESDWNTSSNTWVEKKRTNYEYNASGDCTKEVKYEKASDNSWQWKTRSEYHADSHHNLCDAFSYEYAEGAGDEGTLSVTMHFDYDLTVPAKSIARSSYLGFFVNPSDAYEFNYMITSLSEQLVTDTTDTLLPGNFYYTDVTQVNEQTGQSLKLWPNPVHETMMLNASELKQVGIFTLDGKEVMLLNEDLESINVSTLANGCYILKAIAKDGSVTSQKFIKE